MAYMLDKKTVYVLLYERSDRLYERSDRLYKIGVKARTARSKIHWRYKTLPESENFMSAVALAAAWAIETDSDVFSVRRLEHDTINEA